MLTWEGTERFRSEVKDLEARDKTKGNHQKPQKQKVEVWGSGTPDMDGGRWNE